MVKFFFTGKQILLRFEDNPWCDKEVQNLLRKKNELLKNYQILTEDKTLNIELHNSNFSV